jgi:methionyl-tRNA synthetase
MVSIEQFEALDLRVGEILSAEGIEGASKLYKLRIEMGGRQLQVVAGLKQNYSPDELTGKKVIVIVNLEPAKIRGVESQAMLLAAVDEGIVSLLTPDRDISAGSKVM